MPDLMATAAASLIWLASAQLDQRIMFRGRLSFNQALCTEGRLTTDRADGLEIVHIFGNTHDVGKRTERIAPKIHIQAGNNDSLAPIRQKLDNFRKRLVKELGPVYRHHTLLLTARNQQDLMRPLY